MAVDPWFSIFPAAAAVTFAALAVQVFRKRAGLSGAHADWSAAMLLCAGGFGGTLVAAALSWNDAADITVAATGAGAALGLVGAFSGLLQRYTRGRWGTPKVRLALFGAGLALVTFGLGAAAGSAGQPGDGAAAGSTFIPVVAGVAALFPVLVLSTLRGSERAGLAGTLQLCLGGGIVAVGLVVAALGELFIGPALGMAGGGVLYSGILAAVGKAPGERTPTVKPKVEAEQTGRPVSGSGRKVMVPKGAAVRVTSFRDDEPGDTK